jgi:hypothetical protein
MSEVGSKSAVEKKICLQAQNWYFNVRRLYHLWFCCAILLVFQNCGTMDMFLEWFVEYKFKMTRKESVVAQWR